MSILELHSAHMRVAVDPAQGAEITELAPAGGPNVLFHGDWRAPLPAARSRSYGNDVLDWLSEYRGGWQELFPNAGAPCEVMGVPLPFHGEVSRARWDVEWLEEASAVRLTCAARLPLVLERTMTLDPARPVLRIEERVVNESAQDVPYIWGHHPAFGPPLAAAGARIDLPAGTVVADAGLDGPAVDLAPGSTHAWPLATGRGGERVDLAQVPDGPAQRLCYISDLAGGWYAMRNPARGLGAALAWDLDVFPCLWLWQEIRGGRGMPWYGRAEITALEPATQFPAHGLAAAVEAGQARLLPPGSEARAALAVVLFAADERPVTGVSPDGRLTFGA